MADSFTLDLMSHLTAQIAAVANAALPQILQELQESVSVPVGRSGSLVIRSQPGEPPRLETGNLRGSIDGEVIVDFETVTIRVWASADYARYLEEGTATMEARPFLRPILERWLQELPKRLTAEQQQTLY